MTAENYFIKDQNSVYYLTFTIEDWVDVFTVAGGDLQSPPFYQGFAIPNNAHWDMQKARTPPALNMISTGKLTRAT